MNNNIFKRYFKIFLLLVFLIISFKLGTFYQSQKYIQIQKDNFYHDCDLIRNHWYTLANATNTSRNTKPSLDDFQKLKEITKDLSLSFSSIYEFIPDSSAKNYFEEFPCFILNLDYSSLSESEWSILLSYLEPCANLQISSSLDELFESTSSFIFEYKVTKPLFANSKMSLSDY